MTPLPLCLLECISADDTVDSGAPVQLGVAGGGDGVADGRCLPTHSANRCRAAINGVREAQQHAQELVCLRRGGVPLQCK